MYKGERRIGPMVVVCPEHAVLAPEEEVIYQGLAIANWDNSIFVLGGADWPEGLAPYQQDYVNSLNAVVDEKRSLWMRCGSRLSDVESGIRMLMRHRSFLAASSGRREVSVVGGYTEAHVRRIVEILSQAGIDAVIHSTSVAYAQINPEALRALL